MRNDASDRVIERIMGEDDPPYSESIGQGKSPSDLDNLQAGSKAAQCTPAMEERVLGLANMVTT